MKLSFKRITSSGNFIPEIDGLRFIAIASVVLLYLSLFFASKDFNVYADSIDYSFLKKFLLRSYLDVPLFFVISGFILGLPFAKHYLGSEKPVNLKTYFFRRLTRLEPPYFLVMTFLLFGAVYVAKTISMNQAVCSYLASVIYSHNFIYQGIYPQLNTPAWSLEIEIQFYIVAPLLAYLFIFKSAFIRRTILISLILVFLSVEYYNTFHFISLMNFIHYFLTGFLLVDLYVSKSFILPKNKFDTVAGLSFFVIIWLFDKSDFSSNLFKYLWELIQLISIFFFYYYVLIHKVIKFFSFKTITNIGGMCYTI